MNISVFLVGVLRHETVLRMLDKDWWTNLAEAITFAESRNFPEVAGARIFQLTTTGSIEKVWEKYHNDPALNFQSEERADGVQILPQCGMNPEPGSVVLGGTVPPMDCFLVYVCNDSNGHEEALAQWYSSAQAAIAEAKTLAHPPHIAIIVVQLVWGFRYEVNSLLGHPVHKVWEWYHGYHERSVPRYYGPGIKVIPRKNGGAQPGPYDAVLGGGQ